MADNSNNTFLDRFAINLNERAAQGKLDPVIGRDDEIRRVLQILSRRTKNNPILVGEPGVGKTAISEGIAQNIVNGQVPENLKSKKVYSLDMGALIAGAKYQGGFIPQWGSGADWLGPAAHHSSEGPVICLQSCCPAGFGGTDP